MKIVRGIPNKYISEILDWSIHFNHIMDESSFRNYVNFMSDFEISFMLIDEKENIVGVYTLLKNEIYEEFPNTEKYEGLDGVEGILLFVEEAYRGKGWGNKLKDMPKEIGYDYVWGRQHKNLNNLDHWLKRRELILEKEREYVTAEIFEIKVN
jgi:GNAT superfamily N-acetyltransferase